MKFHRETLSEKPHYKNVDNARMTRANIGTRYRKNRLINLDSPWSHEVQAYVGEMHKTEKTGLGLVLVGPHGVGKTGAACRVLIEAMARGTVQTYFIQALDIDWYARHRDVVTPEGTSVWNLLVRQAQFLVIDDLCSERDAEWNARWIEHVLSARYDWQLPTIVTSNMEREELFDRVKRLRQLADDAYTIVDTPGPKIRNQ
jgi:DNA replication protein DnaC